MCKFYYLKILQEVLNFLILYFQYQSKTFVDFINDESINKKIKNKNTINDKNNKILFSEKKDEKYYINKINELENKVKNLENKIKEMDVIIKEKDKIINENLKNQINIDNKLSNNNSQINRILELEDEIKKFKTYFLSPGDKLITINLISVDQKVNFSTFAKVNDKFRKIEDIVYEKYPEYQEYENFFLVNGKKVNKNKTLEENNIKDKDVLTLSKIDDDQLIIIQ